jgi:ketosteroid isomerase-like protein
VTRGRRNADLLITEARMSHQQNIAIARALLEGIGGGRDPAEIAALFGVDLVFEIQGDDGVLPWVGRRAGRPAIADFIRDIRALTEPVTFEVEDILASDSRAAIIGALQTKIKATGKIVATQFAIILTITDDVVTRFQMLEDSFAVSKAGRLDAFSVRDRDQGVIAPSPRQPVWDIRK